MSFYTLSDGTKPDGSEEQANIITSTIIPDGTKAIAKIAKFVLKDTAWGKYYEITWSLESTKYKGLTAFQKIRCFEDDAKKKDKALQMLVRVFKLANHTPSHDGHPTDQQLAPLVGRKLGITINQWFVNGKDGNWVSAVYSADKFESAEGVMKQPPAAESKAEPVSSEGAFAAPSVAKDFDDDLPF